MEHRAGAAEDGDDQAPAGGSAVRARAGLVLGVTAVTLVPLAFLLLLANLYELPKLGALRAIVLGGLGFLLGAAPGPADVAGWLRRPSRHGLRTGLAPGAAPAYALALTLAPRAAPTPGWALSGATTASRDS